MLKRAVHPGLALKDELAELGITPTEFARQIGVPPNRVSQIINGKRAITGDTALRFGHWFGVEPEFWLNLQNHFDLVCADRRSGKAVRLLPTRANLTSVHAPTPLSRGLQVPAKAATYWPKPAPYPRRPFRTKFLPLPASPPMRNA